VTIPTRVLAALTAAVLVTSCAQTGDPAAGPSTAAAVNGTVIPLAPIAEVVRAVAEADPEADVAALQRRLITIEIQSVALDQVLAERGLEVTDEQLAALEADIIASIGDEAQLDELLTQLNFTRDFFSRVLVPFEAKLNTLSDSLSVGYVIERRQVRHILVDTEEEAQEIYDLLLGGADFATLAEERSSDPGSAAQGGDLGFAERGAYVPEFDEAVWSSLVGFVRTPVETQFGFHVLEVTDTEEQSGAQLPQEELRARLAPDVEELLSVWLASSIVTVSPGLGTWDPELQQVVAEELVGDGATP